MAHRPVHLVTRLLAPRGLARGVGVGLVIAADILEMMDITVPEEERNFNVVCALHHTHAVRLPMFGHQRWCNKVVAH
jgi:hypothetical protein